MIPPRAKAIHGSALVKTSQPARAKPKRDVGLALQPDIAAPTSCNRGSRKWARPTPSILAAIRRSIELRISARPVDQLCRAILCRRRTPDNYPTPLKREQAYEKHPRAAGHNPRVSFGGAPTPPGPTPPGPPPSSGSSEPRAVRGSVNGLAALLRTPDLTNKLPNIPFANTIERTDPKKGEGVRDLVNKVIPVGPSVLGHSSINIRFVENNHGKYDREQSSAGTKWVKIAKDFRGDAQVQYGNTYEWTAGVYGTVGGSSGTNGDPVRGSGGGGYSQFKLVSSVRIQEEKVPTAKVLSKRVSTLRAKHGLPHQKEMWRNREWPEQTGLRQFRIRYINHVTVQEMVSRSAIRLQSTLW